VTELSSIQTESKHESGICESEFTSSVDLSTRHEQKISNMVTLNELNKDIWSKKERNEVLTVSSRRSQKKTLSNRKQSTPVEGMQMISGGYSWKKNRKQSDNIIFNSMDGWKMPMNMMKHMEQSNIQNISKSTVFSLKVGVKRNLQKMDKQVFKSFEHSSTNNTETQLRQLEKEQDKKNEKESRANILSNETNYTSYNFFQNAKKNSENNLNDIKSKSYLNLEKQEEMDLQSGSITKDNLPKRRSLFVLDPLNQGPNQEMATSREGYLNNFSLNSENNMMKESFDDKTSNNEQFSLAKQNEHISKKLKLENIENSQDLLLKLETVHSLHESPVEASVDQMVSKGQDTPIVSNQHFSINPSTNEVQTNSQINLDKSMLTQSISSSKSSNHLKMRLKRKQRLKLEKEKEQKKATMVENLQNLNNLIEKIDEDDIPREDFSQLDINLMKTLSKSLERSKPFLNTRSRYEFVEQRDTLQTSDIVFNPRDLSGNEDQSVLSIMHLIKAFLAPSQSTTSGRRYNPSSQDKVKISF
jgi:hypothetical protein